MRTNIWNYEKGQLCNREVAESNNRESLRLLWEVMLEGALDLHTHSNVSDGKTSPPQLVQEVLTHRLKVFAGVCAVSLPTSRRLRDLVISLSR